MNAKRPGWALYDPRKTLLSESFSKKDDGFNVVQLTSIMGDPEGRPLMSSSSPTNFSISTGWDWDLRLLLLNGLISILWGLALAIFSTGVVPIAWSISQVAQNFPTVTNTVVALVAATATRHITYILQAILEQYSHVVVVDGFTLGGLRWMQGVKEMSIFTEFPDGKSGGRLAWLSKKRLLWCLIYLGIFFHTASLVAILQPELFFKNVAFDDAVPCGKDTNNLTLDVDPSVMTPAQQQVLDSFSFDVGLGLATYGQQVNGNTTQTYSGRVYVRDAYAYGAVGGLANGLQEIPGAMFTAQCSEDMADATSIWQASFPGRPPPSVSTLSNTSREFMEADIPAQLQNVTSHTGPFPTPANAPWAAMYALVNATGSGAYLGLQSTPNGETSLVCSWQAVPKTVHVQTVDFAAQTLGSSNSDTLPAVIGRATWNTLNGMAEAARTYSASLYTASRSPYDEALRGNIAGVSLNATRKAIPEVLETLLADGGKASLSIFNNYYWWLFRQPHNTDPGCNSRNRTLSPHWRFGNSRNLGWIAVVWTTGMGVFGVASAVWMSKRRRMAEVSVLNVAEAFVLGRQDMIRDVQPLCIRDGRVVEAQ